MCSFHRVKDRSTKNTMELMHESKTDTFGSQIRVMSKAKAICAIPSYGIKVLLIFKITQEYAMPGLLAALRRPLHEDVVMCKYHRDTASRSF